MDVNEEIVVLWLNLCKNRFTRENIKFKVLGSKGGSNYSDIDILALDTDGNYYDYEIKWRARYSLSSNNQKNINSFINQLTRKERKDKIKEIIGNKTYKKIFVTTVHFFGATEKKRKFLKNEFNKKGIDIIYFRDIIKELVDKVSKKGRYDSNILQIIRMLKYYKLLKN